LGKKVEHCAVQRVEISRTRGQDFKNPDYDSKNPNPQIAEFIGQKIKAKTVKNKVGGRDGQVATIDFYYGYGLDTIGEMISIAKHIGILQGSGWMSLIDPSTSEIIAKYQGEGQWKKALEENDSLWEQLANMVYGALHGYEGEVPVDESTETELSSD
jgi:hypothetical protein